ncbi:hypothetical protein EVAR_24674_1 [Eumeta japonica]|uniref:Uncharacterized protein n=1 Tax=Eumeta variegata TaxID=151549 RepID=A0A4C1WG57_EUMVA|nr:hypothetical protein EVAR_24674_1 [Eumeta japonica]
MPQGKVIKGQTRKFVLRLRVYFEKESLNGGPLIPATQVRDCVATALGISAPTVVKMTKEGFGSSGMEQNKLSILKKKRQPCKVTAIDSFVTDVIRRSIYDYYQKKKIPTFKKLVQSLRNSGLFRGQKSSLAKVLKGIGFRFKKCDKRKILMERNDVALCRCEFLRQAKKIEERSNVVFVDELGSMRIIRS